MYTQCPVCKTVFRLQIGQLKAAKGQVRCSRCLATFDALDNLYEAPQDEAGGKSTVAPPAQRPTHKEAVRPSTTPPSDRSVTGTTPNIPPKTVQRSAPKPESRTAPAPETKPASLRESKPAPRSETIPTARRETRPAPNHETKATPRSVTKPAIKPETKPTFSQEAKTVPRPETKQGLKQNTKPATRPETRPALSQEAKTTPRQETKPALRQKSKPVHAPKPEPTSRPKIERVKEPKSQSGQQPGSKPVPKPEQAPKSRLKQDSATASGKSGERDRLTDANLDLFADTSVSPSLSSKSEQQIQPKAVSTRERLLANEPSVPKEKKEEISLPPGSEATLIEEITLTDGTALTSKVEMTSPDWGNSRESEQQVLKGQHRANVDAELNSGENSETIPDLELDEALIEKHDAEDTDYTLPLELEQTRPRGGFFTGFLWFVGILVMLAGLGLQYIYYHRIALADKPELRQVLTQMCDLTGCQLPPRRNVKAIALGDHLIQSHPRYENSLLITATLINHADFAQPYPVLEMIMTDLQQNEIARRRFLPKEYLVGENGANDFAPGSEEPVMLEVIDPGKQAVGFEFNFY